MFRADWDDRMAGKLFELTVPEQSVTRAAVEGVLPADALLQISLDGYSGVCCGYGVIYFLVRQLPQKPICGGNDQYVCYPFHAPYPCNYAHSEIRLARATQREVPACTNSVRRQYRAILRNNLIAAAANGKTQIALLPGAVVFNDSSRG